MHTVFVAAAANNRRADGSTSINSIAHAQVESFDRIRGEPQRSGWANIASICTTLMHIQFCVDFACAQTVTESTVKTVRCRRQTTIIMKMYMQNVDVHRSHTAHTYGDREQFFGEN